MEEKYVQEVLKLLEKNKIEYGVLRGFIPIEEIDVSKDVDIYVPLKYKEKVDTMFKYLGWYTQKLNCSRYPHKQYIYITKYGVKKIDIVYGLYYSNALLKYKKQDDILDEHRIIEGIDVLNQKNTLETFILHVCFDKQELSEKNERYLKLIVDDYYNSDYYNENSLFLEIANLLLSGKKRKEDILEYQKRIKKSNLLEYNYGRYIFNTIKIRINNIVRVIWLRLSKKNISIVGVDGSGKSTTVERLNKILGNKCITQYFGFKDYNLKFVKKHFENVKNNILYKINSILFQWIEMVNRYFKYRYSKLFIIMDRFPNEAIINFRGIAKAIATILYGAIYPKPKKIYYLYCNVNTSFERKDDILEKEKFEIRKNKFDKKYLNMKKVTSFSTDKKSTEEIIDVIIEDLNKYFLKYFI